MASPGSALSAVASRNIIRPGANLARAAQETLTDPRRAEGKYPFQWLYPGPNSQMAVPNGSIAIPGFNAPATSAQAQIFSYQVPEGMRFRATGILMNAFASDWNPGSGQLLFSFIVQYSTGPRNVEFLSNLAFPLGSTFLPWPLEGRIEFAPLDVLEVVLTNKGISAPNAADYAYAAINGYTYPNSENA